MIAVSSEIAGRRVAAGARPDRVTTVLNGIDTERFRHHPDLAGPARASFKMPSSTAIVGSVGRLERQKRFDLLIEAVARLRQQQRDVTLVIVGDGSLAPALRAHASMHGVADACVFAGHRTDVVDVLHAFDVFAQSSEYEGTPNCVLEAMAVGTPVVATTVGGTAELIEDHVHGLLVPPITLARLADLALGSRTSRRGRPPAHRRDFSTDADAEGRTDLKRSSTARARAPTTAVRRHAWTLKVIARGLATLVVMRALLFLYPASDYRRRSRLEGSTQALGLVPELLGHTCGAPFSNAHSRIARRLPRSRLAPHSRLRAPHR